jgi:hypothetical protein
MDIVTFFRLLEICGLVSINPIKRQQQRKEIQSAAARELARLDRERCNQSDTTGPRHLLGCRSDICHACQDYLARLDK